MTHKTKRVLLVENPNAGASDKQALLKELREGLLSQGFLVEQENKPESIQKCLRAASEENNRFACVICAGGMEHFVVKSQRYAELRKMAERVGQFKEAGRSRRSQSLL